MNLFLRSILLIFLVFAGQSYATTTAVAYGYEANAFLSSVENLNNNGQINPSGCCSNLSSRDSHDRAQARAFFAFAADFDVPKGTADDFVDLSSGCKGAWCGELNKPKPNTSYKVDDNYAFSTDSMGRTNKVEGELNLNTKDRNTYQQCKAGNCGNANDEGGHLIANIFNGPGEKINLVPMNGNLNKGEWKKLENTWAGALKEGKSVKVTVEPVYSGNSVRPDSFSIGYSVDGGRIIRKTFLNTPGGN